LTHKKEIDTKFLQKYRHHLFQCATVSCNKCQSRCDRCAHTTG